MSLAIVQGIHRWPHQWPVTWKIFSFDGHIIYWPSYYPWPSTIALWPVDVRVKIIILAGISNPSKGWAARNCVFHTSCNKPGGGPQLNSIDNRAENNDGHVSGIFSVEALYSLALWSLSNDIMELGPCMFRYQVFSLRHQLYCNEMFLSSAR